MAGRGKAATEVREGCPESAAALQAGVLLLLLPHPACCAP